MAGCPRFGVPASAGSGGGFQISNLEFEIKEGDGTRISQRGMNGENRGGNRAGEPALWEWPAFDRIPFRTGNGMNAEALRSGRRNANGLGKLGEVGKIAR